MSRSEPGGVFRVAVLSVVKHAYVPLGMSAHPRFEPVVVADDPAMPDWVHARNTAFAEDLGVPYVRDVEAALRDYGAHVACVTSEAERHCDLGARAASAGLHVVQDKPMSTKVSECDRVVEAVARNRVKFLLWNRNFMPSLVHARQAIADGAVGTPRAIHVDFYFSSDAGPLKGSRGPSDPPINWLEALKGEHLTGGDGGIGVEPMGELKVEGIYPLAYIRHLTGATPRRVYARTASHFHQRHVDNDVEDLASLTLELDREMLGSICIGRIGRFNHTTSGNIKISILGTEGALVINEPRPEIIVVSRDSEDRGRIGRPVGGDGDWLQMDHFAAAIDSDGDTILDAKAGRDIAAAVDAALESGRTDRPVDVS